MPKKNNNLIKKIKTSCRKECNKGKKTMPVVMNKLGKKMGLSQKEVKKRIKEYNKNCESNCIELMQDKDMIQNIIKLQGKKSKKGGKTLKKRKVRTRRYKRGGASGALVKYSKDSSFENEIKEMISRITDEEIEIFNKCFDEELMLTTIEYLIEYYLDSTASMKMKLSFMKKLNEKYDKHLVDLHLNNLMELDALCIDYTSGLLDENTKYHLENFFKKLLIVVLGLSVENNPPLENFLRENLQCDVNSFKHNFEPLTGGGKRGSSWWKSPFFAYLLLNERTTKADPITMGAVGKVAVGVCGTLYTSWKSFSWFSDIYVGVVKVDDAVTKARDFGAELMDIPVQIERLSDDVINELANKYIDKWDAQMNCRTNHAGCNIAPILLSNKMEENNFTPLKDVPVLPDIDFKEHLELPDKGDLDLVRETGNLSRQKINARVKDALSSRPDLVDCSTSTCNHKQKAEYNYYKSVEEVNYVIDMINDASGSIKGRVAPVLTEIIKIDILVKSMSLYKSMVGDKFVDDIATTFTGEALRVLNKVEGPDESYLDQMKSYFISAAQETHKRVALTSLLKDAADFGLSRSIDSVIQLNEQLRESSNLVIGKDISEKTTRLKLITDGFTEAHRNLGNVGMGVAIAFDGLFRISLAENEQDQLGGPLEGIDDH